MPVAICFSNLNHRHLVPALPLRGRASACDANKQALAFVYCEDEPGRRTTGKLLARDEARRIENVAKPEKLSKIYRVNSLRHRLRGE